MMNYKYLASFIITWITEAQYNFKNEMMVQKCMVIIACVNKHIDSDASSPRMVWI